MVSVVYTPQKGLVEELGTAGVVRINSPIAEAQESLQLSGAKYELTFEADVASDTDGSYFIIFDKIGRSYAIWFDIGNSGTAIPAPAAAADFNLEITTAQGGLDSGAKRATVIAGAADTAFGTAFEFEASGAVLSIYVLEVGGVTGNKGALIPVAAPVPKISANTFADGQIMPTPISNYGATNLDVLPQSDVTNVVSEVALPDGDTIGQKKLIAIPVALSNGTLALTGKFTHAGNHGRTRCVLAAAANSFLYCVWSGTRWATISSNGASFA